MQLHPTPALAAMVALGVLATPAAAMPVLPDFGAALFDPTQPVNNLYFPLIPGSQTVLVAEFEDGGETVTERSELTVLGPGPTILGVQTTTQLDRAFEGNLLVEETRDFYAQDTLGNVWYMGEDVTNFIYDDDGELIEMNDDSAWRAGVNGALPGFIMPADPMEGFNYYQEFAEADEALDQATISALGLTITLDELGIFIEVLRIFETTELDPDAREFKYYAPGIGVIRADEGLNPGLQNPELVFQAISIGPAPVPLPAALPLALGALALLGVVGLGRRRA